MIKMDLGKLKLTVDGVTRSFSEWTSHYASTYYPQLGKSCYRVPAVHFNRQKLQGDDLFRRLVMPDTGQAYGDLAHTMVLDWLEQTGRQLQTRDGTPLFIISSFNYDNFLARLKAPKGKNKSQCSIPPRPKDMPCERPPRGDIDVLVLHQNYGVMLVEVKATNADPKWTTDEAHRRSAIGKSVLHAIEQLIRGEDVFRFIMPDLQPPPNVTRIVALPFVDRQQLKDAITEDQEAGNIRFLCKDDMQCQTPTDRIPASESQVETKKPRLEHSCSWWDDNFRKLKTSLSLDLMKTVVGRICGLMSIVSVWTHSKPRVEVRTQGQAVSEVGRRVSDIVLLPSQAALLADPTLTRLCLTGPMGSGKTLMLQLKGRQWARQGKRVVILNVRTSGKGRPVGHLLEKAIKHNIDVGCETNTGSVERHDVAIKEFDLKVFKETLEKDGLLDSLCFILDELTNLTLLEQLANEYPDSPIWSVVMYLREPPQNFKHRMLKSVLRCPPSVQLMLKELDLNPLHKDNAYTTRSTARGLPCDGPPIIFIQHRKHDTKARPLDCSDCAQELDDILLNKLGLKSLLASPAEGCATSQASAQEVPKRTAAADLSFRDVLLLVCMPLAYYKPGGPDLWEASMKDAHKFYQYVTASKFFKGLLKSGLPLNPVTDNTSREIACPSDDKIVITEIMGVQSIERKVVFFLPGGPPFDTLGSGLTAESGASAETRSYPERPDDDTHTAEELQQLFGKMIVGKPDRSGSFLKEVSSTKDLSSIVEQPGKPARMGMDLRGDSPAVRAALEKLGHSESSEARGGGTDDVSDDAAFLVSDSSMGMAEKTEELERIREELARLSMDDQDWLFLAAGRCLSQLIVVTP